MYRDTMSAPSSITSATRNRCRALRQNGMMNRPTINDPMANAHSAHQ